MGDYP
jgi:hypothetical protein